MAQSCLRCGKAITQPALGRRRVRCEDCQKRHRAEDTNRRRAANTVLGMTPSVRASRGRGPRRKVAELYSTIDLLADRILSVNAAYLRIHEEAAKLDWQADIRLADDEMAAEVAQLIRIYRRLREQLGAR